MVWLEKPPFWKPRLQSRVRRIFLRRGGRRGRESGPPAATHSPGLRGRGRARPLGARHPHLRAPRRPHAPARTAPAFPRLAPPRRAGSYWPAPIEARPRGRGACEQSVISACSAARRPLTHFPPRGSSTPPPSEEGGPTPTQTPPPQPRVGLGPPRLTAGREPGEGQRRHTRRLPAAGERKSSEDERRPRRERGCDGGLRLVLPRRAGIPHHRPPAALPSYRHRLAHVAAEPEGAPGHAGTRVPGTSSPTRGVPSPACPAGSPSLPAGAPPAPSPQTSPGPPAATAHPLQPPPQPPFPAGTATRSLMMLPSLGAPSPPPHTHAPLSPGPVGRSPLPGNRC